MIRSLWVSVLCVFSLSAAAQAILRCEVQGCRVSPALFEFDGSSFFPVRQPDKVEENVYEFQFRPSENRFYYIGTNTSNMTPVILGEEEEVVVKGPCLNFRGARIESPVLLVTPPENRATV